MPVAGEFGVVRFGADGKRRFLAVGGMDNYAAAGSSSGGSGDGGAAPRRNTRKPKCEISFHDMILMMLSSLVLGFIKECYLYFPFHFGLGLELFC